MLEPEQHDAAKYHQTHNSWISHVLLATSLPAFRLWVSQSPYWKHLTCRPVAGSVTVGMRTLQTSFRNSHCDANGHPVTFNCSSTVGFVFSLRRTPFRGNAARRACVYGCMGVSSTSRKGPSSTMCPAYMTITLSANPESNA